MKSQLLLAFALLLASGATLAKTSECDNSCEKTFKYCSTAGKSSQKVCLGEREKCRKRCIKNEKALPIN